MVWFVFVIMMLNAGEEERTNFSTLATCGGIPLALALGGVIAAAIARSSGHLPPPAASGVMSSTKEISKLLFSEFVYPFELTSFMFLVAILGAIVLAQRENYHEPEQLLSYHERDFFCAVRADVRVHAQPLIT